MGKNRLWQLHKARFNASCFNVNSLPAYRDQTDKSLLARSKCVTAHYGTAVLVEVSFWDELRTSTNRLAPRVGSYGRNRCVHWTSHDPPHFADSACISTVGLNLGGYAVRAKRNKVTDSKYYMYNFKLSGVSEPFEHAVDIHAHALISLVIMLDRSLDANAKTTRKYTAFHTSYARRGLSLARNMSIGDAYAKACIIGIK
eukprot:4551938-Pleurochrysis_carterae.AAC.1